MKKMSNTSQTKFPYLVAAVGVGLMAISELYSFVRAMMFRAMFRPSGGYGSGFSGRQFGGGFGFGPSILTTIALVVAIAGIVWLGLELRKSPKSTQT